MVNFEELVLRAQEGNKQDKEEIISAFQPLIFSLRKQSTYAAIADEVPSICYETILEAVQNYRGESFAKFPGYIKQQLIFALNNYLRKTKVITSHETANIADHNVTSLLWQDYTPDTINRLVLKGALRKLTSKQRKVVIGYFLLGMLDKVLAQKLSISIQSVHRLRRRAIANLRKLLGA